MIFCCCQSECTIASDTFDDGTTTGWTTTGTVTEAGGLMDMAGGSTAIFDTETGGVNELAAVKTFPLNTDASAELRLRICYSDANNFLFGMFFKDADGSGLIRLGQVVAGAETWLTDSVVVDDTDAELDARGTLCLSFEPGEVQTGAQYVAHALPQSTSGGGWTNPSNAETQDDTGATHLLPQPGPGTTGALVALDFPFSIPPGSTIDSVNVSVRARGDAAIDQGIRCFVQLQIGGSAAGDAIDMAEFPTGSGYSTSGFGDAGTPLSQWNTDVAWDDIDAAFGFAVWFTWTTDTLSTSVDVDVMQIEITYTTPDRQPGKLRFAYTNTGAPNNTQCVTDYAAENPAGGRKTGLHAASGDWDFTSYELSCTACPCDTEDAEPCECCAPDFPPAAAYVVDFGAGGWTNDGVGCDCEGIEGEIVLTATTACGWFKLFDLGCEDDCGGSMVARFVTIGLSLVESGGNCYWRLGINTNVGCVSGSDFATYTSANLASDEDCQALPVTLTKQIENTGNQDGCAGSLPSTVTLEAA